jgi:hypothetical protein
VFGRTAVHDYSGQLAKERQAQLEEAYGHPSASDCFFYHTMQFGATEIHPGAWDLRREERKYLGYLDFRGQRVLELGPATGYLGFWMEAQGAEVVCLEVPPGLPQDLLPLPEADLADHRVAGVAFAEKIRNSWWYSRGRLGSRNKAVYADIYDLPQDLGRFDVCTFGSILLHLENPYRALAQAASLTDKAMVVTDMLQQLPPDLKSHAMEFNPRGEPGNLVNWWGVSPGAIIRMLAVLGFPEHSVYFHTQKHHAHHDLTASAIDVELFTVVGRRNDARVSQVPRPAADIDEENRLIRIWRKADPVSRLETELRELRESACWRATQPIRWFLDLFKK